MKKILFLSVLAIALVGCNKEYYGKCEQVYDKHALPALDWNDYNDCDRVAINHVYMARWGDRRYLNRHPNPYESKEGEIIKIKGYILHSFNRNRMIRYDGDKWTCYMVNDSLIAMDTTDRSGNLSLEGTDKSLLEGVDFTRKCYVTATITFHTMFPMLISPADPRSCFAITPIYKVIEIKN